MLEIASSAEYTVHSATQNGIQTQGCWHDIIVKVINLEFEAPGMKVVSVQHTIIN